MSYAKKTCNICGIRKEQPDMVRSSKQVKSGSSNTGLTKRSIIGATFGNKKSQSAVGKWMLSPNKRNYTKTREVWMCHDCAGVNSKKSEADEFSTFSLLVILSVFLGILYLLTGISPVDIIEYFE